MVVRRKDGASRSKKSEKRPEEGQKAPSKSKSTPSDAAKSTKAKDSPSSSRKAKDSTSSSRRTKDSPSSSRRAGSGESGSGSPRSSRKDGEKERTKSKLSQEESASSGSTGRRKGTARAPQREFLKGTVPEDTKAHQREAELKKRLQEAQRVKSGGNTGSGKVRAREEALAAKLAELENENASTDDQEDQDGEEDDTASAGSMAEEGAGLVDDDDVPDAPSMRFMAAAQDKLGHEGAKQPKTAPEAGTDANAGGEEPADDYGDDFEDYDDDFEDDGGDDDDESEQDDASEESGSDSELELDNANGIRYPKDSIDPEVADAMRLVAEENQQVADRRSPRPQGTSPGGGRFSFAKEQESKRKNRRERPKTGVNFGRARQTFRSKATAKSMKRFNELKDMIELDFVTIDLFDLPPLSEYDQYIKNFGASNASQTYTQTGQDAYVPVLLLCTCACHALCHALVLTQLA